MFYNCFQYFGAFLYFNHLLERSVFKPHPSSDAINRNQPIDLNCLLIAWFLDNDNTRLKWVKKNLIGCLHITTPTWKPSFRETSLFSRNTGVKTLLTFSFCFNGRLSLTYIKDITRIPTTSKMELLETLVIGFKSLTNVTTN